MIYNMIDPYMIYNMYMPSLLTYFVSFICVELFLMYDKPIF